MHVVEQNQRLKARIQCISGLVVADELYIWDMSVTCLIQFILSFAYNYKVEREYFIFVKA